MTERRQPQHTTGYTANERTNHWLTAIGFVLAGSRGLDLTTRR